MTKAEVLRYFFSEIFPSLKKLGVVIAAAWGCSKNFSWVTWCEAKAWKDFCEYDFCGGLCNMSDFCVTYWGTEPSILMILSGQKLKS